MKTRTAIDHFGTAVALAKSLGISKQSISRWGEEVPPRRAFEIERLTDGKLKADFTPPTQA
ncbi:Cro/CI family transcriptional regulator [Vibrio brasiliensis]|uniref:Cro/CI family transcriptional regulator n=1 Tax=Vibrio brasiliensis TaxID=170652 RepID=UPI001EFC6E0C|nr:Cro/CI family transcriptional regulator [Vibrio brasiliensis]MCG9782663.1 Cro/CI family transcriptional regulator [Vibrio brasiliensis]